MQRYDRRHSIQKRVKARRTNDKMEDAETG
jgi:hypothetical protein